MQAAKADSDVLEELAPSRPPEGDLLTFYQLAEYVIWALLEPPDVDVDTIIVGRFGAMI